MTTAPLELFSADSHVVEPGHCYVDNIESKYKDRAPHYKRAENGGEVLVVEDFPPLKAGTLAASGHKLGSPELAKMTLAEANRGAFDPKQRLLDQDLDGVIAEVIYPTVGMYVCANEDADYKQACFWAYNRWLKDEFISYAPERLIGLGMTAVRSVDEAIDDVRKIKEMGFKGVMLPSEPSTKEDYDDKTFDRLWSVCTEMDMPISFHIFSSRAMKKLVHDQLNHQSTGRGPPANRTQDVLRNVQDVIGMFIWGGVFERHPKLKLVCTEADAGWAPHYMLYADHYYLDRPDRKFGGGLTRKPSEYFMENVYMTFQRDWVALQMLHLLNPQRLLWANDFPHPDACWLQSQSLLAEHAAHLSPEHKSAILCDNVRNLYGLKQAA
jgi:predicted TIM-barrel fold metal-dependent hydrolase